MVTSGPTSLGERVAELFDARDRGEAATWLRAALADTSATALRVALARAPRKLGRDPLSLGPAERLRHELPEHVEAASWRGFDLARIALVAAALERTSVDQHVVMLEPLIRTGEITEQESLLRGLCLLPDPSRFVAVAIDACRTNAVCVFEAIACENPLPADHFPEPAFNQMVLKAVFLGVAIARIVGLERRANPELVRMALAYASEREAAGRSVPADIGRIQRIHGA